MEKDLRDILLALNSQSVKYLIVGGYAVSVHSEPRATKDLDIWIQTDAENAKAVYRALATYGAPLAGLTPDDFNGLSKTGYQIGVAPVRIDVLHSIDGVLFEEAWPRCIETLMDGDIPVRVISKEDLITNKLEAGRPRDLLDVKAIHDASQHKKRGSTT